MKRKSEGKIKMKEKNIKKCKISGSWVRIPQETPMNIKVCRNTNFFLYLKIRKTYVIIKIVLKKLLYCDCNIC